MKRHEERVPAELRAALESWDPVRREGEPAADEVAAVRRRVLAAAPPARAPWTVRWRPVVLAAAAVVLVVVLVHERGDGRSAMSRTEPGSASAARVEADGGRSARPPGGEEAREAAAADSAAAGSGRPAHADRGRQPATPPTRDLAGIAVPERLADAGPRPIAGGPAAASPGDDAPPLVTGAEAAAEAAEETRTGPAAPSAPDRLAAAPGSAAAEAAPSLAGAPGAAAPAREIHREIHIVAPGGTRIVWLVAAGPDPSTDSAKEST